MVVTGRAHRAAVEAQLPELVDPNVVLESEPRDSIGGHRACRRHPANARTGCHRRLLRRRPCDQRMARRSRNAVNEAVGRGRSRIHRHDRHHADGASCRIRLHPLRWTRSRSMARRARSRWTASSRSPTSRPRKGTSPTAGTSGMRACSSRAPTGCSSRWRNRSPNSLPGCEELAEAWDTPARGAVVDQVWPRLTKIAIDYTVAEPAAAAGRLAVIPGHFDWDDVGDFASIAKLHTAGRKSDLAILGEGARVLADSSSGVVISQSGRLDFAHRRQRHHRRRHPGRPPGHHKRQRTTGQEPWLTLSRCPAGEMCSSFTRRRGA